MLPARLPSMSFVHHGTVEGQLIMTPPRREKLQRFFVVAGLCVWVPSQKHIRIFSGRSYAVEL